MQDLYNSDSDEDFEVECLDEGPDITKEEVGYALKKMRERQPDLTNCAYS